MTALSMVV